MDHVYGLKIHVINIHLVHLSNSKLMNNVMNSVMNVLLMEILVFQ